MVAVYERMRGEVLHGQARPEGFGALMYHGLIEGLRLLCSSSATTGVSVGRRALSPQPICRDGELLRLLANMVLQTQSEVMHVY
jgi:hypothetical protein